MQGTASNLSDYADAYVETNWGDYSVQAQIQIPAGGWGAGLSGRLNPANGACYTAVLYPQGGSPLAAGSAVLQLIKFEAWKTWSYNPLAEVNLSGLDTNWHTLKLAFRENRIAVYYDGDQVAAVTDNSFDGVPAFTNGGIGLHMFMSSPFVTTFDNVMVSPLVTDDSYGENENTNLVVGAPGVLGNDTAVYGTNLVAVLVTSPANGTLNLNTNGGFSYVPATNYVGPDSFTYQAYDGQMNLGIATATITVAPGLSLMTVSVDSSSRAYGQTNPPMTGSLAGVQSGDNITVTYTATANPNSPVGTYAIVPVFNDPSNRLGNYIIITNDGMLTITQATLTVSADNQSRNYGAANPLLTASYNGFMNGDTASVLSGLPALSTPADTNSPVGTYPISIGTGTLSATNYGFNFTNGVLTVGQATLTVSADNYSRSYGMDNPPLTVSYSGFVNGETTNVLSGSPALSTTATINSLAGSYSIIVSNGTLNAANYRFSFVDGILAVMYMPPAIFSLSAANSTDVIITWSAVSNLTYRVQYLSGFDSTNWHDLAPDVTATNNTASAEDNPGGAPMRFYRIMIVP